MSRQLEAVQEARQKKHNSAVVAAVDYQLVEAVQRAGGVLLGFSVKLSGDDCLITLRVLLGGREQIAFVGGATLGLTLIKCVRLALSDKLSFRDSKF